MACAIDGGIGGRPFKAIGIEQVLSNLAKNRTTEKDIRAWLKANGYEATTAKILEVELHAVERPGWLQIFRFRVVMGAAEHYGVVRDDERLRGKNKTQIELFDSAASQTAKLAELSKELIVQGTRSGGYLAFLFLFGILLLAFTAAMFQLFSAAP